MTKLILISGLAGIATCFGGIVVLRWRCFNQRSLALLLGVAAGMMLAVVLLDLIPSSWQYGGLWTIILGIVLGLALLDGLGRLFRARLVSNSGWEFARFRMMGYLIATGIALHDLPEGMAIAVGFEATEHLGLMLATAIGLHNIPEGMAMAVPMRLAGFNTWAVLRVTGLVSLVTPLGALLGLVLVNLHPGLVALLLALAGGAMAHVIFWELLPESLQHQPLAGLMGLVLGILVMTLITLKLD